MDKIALAELCRRWKIVDLRLFGSAIRVDFGAQSDVDLLVTFAADAGWRLFDIVHLQDELRQMFGRDIDIVERSALEQSENYIRRRRILDTAETLYAA